MKLDPHPETPSVAVQSVDATVWQAGDRWHFRYLVESIECVALPEIAEPTRADGLWKTTCFEAFVGLGGDAYLEFNFSPSHQWAAYRFDVHRQGMRDEPADIDVWLEAGQGWIAVEAAVAVSSLRPNMPLGLTAVIEEISGIKSYWALAHPDGPPDFHDHACFTALVAEIDRA